MAIIKTFEAQDLKREFERFDRDYFSLSACEAIVNLFEEKDTKFELDIIALCCDFTEETEEYIKDNYSNIEEIANAETTDDLLEALNYYTWAVETSDGILYQNF